MRSGDQEKIFTPKHALGEETKYDAVQSKHKNQLPGRVSPVNAELRMFNRGVIHALCKALRFPFPSPEERVFISAKYLDEFAQLLEMTLVLTSRS